MGSGSQSAVAPHFTASKLELRAACLEQGDADYVDRSQRGKGRGGRGGRGSGRHSGRLSRRRRADDDDFSTPTEEAGRGSKRRRRGGPHAT